MIVSLCLEDERFPCAHRGRRPEVREAWKYGERALRSCHLNLGHQLAALGASCELHGWTLEEGGMRRASSVLAPFVAMPFAPSSVLARSSKARSY